MKMKWWQISIVLSGYGFFKEYRPSEPFITPYLTNFKNFTVDEINQRIYPLGTYFNLFLLVTVFLLTDLLRYKPILLAGGCSAILTWLLLIYGNTIEEMQVVEFFYGFFLASEVAYFTYMYTKVDKAYYQRVTSHTRAAFLFGKASAGLSSQLFIDLGINFLELNYLTVFGVGVATLCGFFLPSVEQSLYFHHEEEKGEVQGDGNDVLQMKWVVSQSNHKLSYAKCRSAYSCLMEDFKAAFTNGSVLEWSIWWALAMCGHLQVISYSQLLWEDIVQEHNSSLYHGYVEFISSLLGSAVAFYIGYLHVKWKIWGEMYLGVVTIIQGCLLFYCSYVNNLYLAYLMHITYQILYNAGITVANYEVAKFIKDRSYALVFGINTFLALLIQTLLTTVVINVLKLKIRCQFLVYGGYHVFIGLAFLVVGVLNLMCLRGKHRLGHL